MSAATTDPRPRTAFISGPIDTGSFFSTHYPPMIDPAISANHHFVIGPIPSGVDADALAYLLESNVPPSDITVCVTPAEDSIWGAKFRAQGVNVHVEGTTPRERDAAMTRRSGYDILRWRTESEAREFYGKFYREGHITNTETNWTRRKGLLPNTLDDVS